MPHDHNGLLREFLTHQIDRCSLPEGTFTHGQLLRPASPAAWEGEHDHSELIRQDRQVAGEELHRQLNVGGQIDKHPPAVSQYRNVHTLVPGADGLPHDLHGIAAFRRRNHTPDIGYPFVRRTLTRHVGEIGQSPRGQSRHLGLAVTQLLRHGLDDRGSTQVGKRPQQLQPNLPLLIFQHAGKGTDHRKLTHGVESTDGHQANIEVRVLFGPGEQHRHGPGLARERKDSHRLPAHLGVVVKSCLNYELVGFPLFVKAGDAEYRNAILGGGATVELLEERKDRRVLVEAEELPGHPPHLRVPGLQEGDHLRGGFLADRQQRVHGRCRSPRVPRLQNHEQGRDARSPDADKSINGNLLLVFLTQGAKQGRHHPGGLVVALSTYVAQSPDDRKTLPPILDRPGELRLPKHLHQLGNRGQADPLRQQVGDTLPDLVTGVRKQNIHLRVEILALAVFGQPLHGKQPDAGIERLPRQAIHRGLNRLRHVDVGQLLGRLELQRRILERAREQ